MLITLIEKELIIDPIANHDFPTVLVKDAVTLNHIILEDTLIHLAIGQLNVPLPMLRVIFELSLIVHPSIPQLRKVFVIEGFLQLNCF